ncbi:MAG: glycine/betaine ABC transporter substrate-binding protein [Spirochaetes bacterium]|nr:MAG: glycine/betaine ABC transporter substrate-binding protein [Spirochaetota bacterium]
MGKKIIVFLLVLSLPFFVFAGGKKEAPAEPETPAAEEPTKEKAEAPEKEEAPGTGVPYKPPIDIGTKNFTEQFVVGNLMYLFLKDRGYNVELKTGMSSTVLREAMINGSLDVCMDYTGTQWLTYTQHEFKGESPEEMYQKVVEDDAKRGLIWLKPIWCNNTYAIAVRSEWAEENNVYTLSQFAEYVNSQEGEVKMASDFEFYSRPDGLLGLQTHYGFAFKPEYVTTVLPGITFEYLAEGRSVAAMVFGTDPAVVKYNWVVLEDDKNFWPPYDLAPYVRKEVLDANPNLADDLNELISAFPEDPSEARREMTMLNAKVDIDKMEPEEAAEEWLKEKGLID